MFTPYENAREHILLKVPFQLVVRVLKVRVLIMCEHVVNLES